MAVRPKLRRRRRTKIIATLGPASSDPDLLARLFQAGADVFRLNFSHGTHEDHAKRFAMIRELEQKFDRPIGILADVQGPKLRVGRFSGGRTHLQTGRPFRLDLNPTPGDANRVNLPHPEIIEAATIGAMLLVDDGKLRLRVVHKRPDALETEVMVGGPISDNKGVNVPDIVLPIPALTEKDRIDLEFACSHGANYIGLSFVQRAQDVAEAKELIKGRAWTMVKLEKPQALDNLDAILALTDAVMVARGDLGVELPPEEVPLAQKRIVRLARQLGKPVVVATQMLESMIVSPVPTRAEVSDVATAVFEGADAVMLSAESASGQYPHEAVSTMNRIAEEVEAEEIYPTIITAQRAAPERTGADAIAVATRDVAETLELKVICAWTASGSTGLRIARERPTSSILALTPIVATARRLALVWGVHAVVTDDARDERDMADRACRHAFIEGFAQTGERVIVVAGVPFGTPGATNNMRIALIGPEGGSA